MILLTVDTTAVIISAIGTFGTIVIAVATIYLNKKVKDYHTEVDGKMTILLDAKKAEGRLEEKQHSEIKTDALVDKLVESSRQVPPEIKP